MATNSNFRGILTKIQKTDLKIPSAKGGNVVSSSMCLWLCCPLASIPIQCQGQFLPRLSQDSIGCHNVYMCTFLKLRHNQILSTKCICEVWHTTLGFCRSTNTQIEKKSRFYLWKFIRIILVIQTLKSIKILGHFSGSEPTLPYHYPSKICQQLILFDGRIIDALKYKIICLLSCAPLKIFRCDLSVNCWYNLSALDIIVCEINKIYNWCNASYPCALI